MTKFPNYFNSSFDYKDIDYILKLKTREYSQLSEIVSKVLDVFKKEFDMNYTINEEIVMSSDVDYSLTKKIEIEIEGIQKIFLDFPHMDQFAMLKIHGVKRTPCIQLIDKPIVTRKDKVRFVTNVDIMELHHKDNFLLNTTFFQPGINFMPYLLATLGVKECKEKLGFEFIVEKPDEPIHEYFRPDCLAIRLDEKRNHHPLIKQLIESIFNIPLDISNGDLFHKNVNSNEFWKKQVNNYIKTNQKGMNLNSLELSISSILKIDIFSKLYVEEETVPDALLSYLQKEPLDESDINNKRIRCIEHMLFDVLKYFHNLYVNLALGRRIYYISDEKKFKLDDIVIQNRLSINEYQFNPLTELSEYVKITQTGPLGFIRAYFREKRRDIHDSQRNYFCPVATPDRENCGVILHLVAGNKNRDFSLIYKSVI